MVAGRLERFEKAIFRPLHLRLLAAFVLGIYIWVLYGLYASNGGILDASGKPVFHDFIWMWTASYDVLHGTAARAYDQAHFAFIQSSVLQTAPGRFGFFHFVYPPTALLLIAPLALAPYSIAFVAWTAATLALYCWTIWLIVPARTSLLLALIPFPVWVNIILGQNGLLNAALVGLALVMMEARPVLAGVCLGILSYKPQLDLLFPVILMVAKRWRVLVAAAACALALAGTATIAFGFVAWPEWLRHLSAQAASSHLMPDRTLAAVQHSFYGVAIWLGATPSAAWAVQATGAIFSLLAVTALWRSSCPFAVKAAGLALGIAAATPYLLFYDLALLSIPAALLVRNGLSEGFLPGERLGLAACFLLQFFDAIGPCGLFVIVLMGLLVFRRALTWQRRSSPHQRAAQAQVATVGVAGA